MMVRLCVSLLLARTAPPHPACLRDFNCLKLASLRLAGYSEHAMIVAPCAFSRNVTGMDLMSTQLFQLRKDSVLNPNAVRLQGNGHGSYGDTCVDACSDYPEKECNAHLSGGPSRAESGVRMGVCW